MVFLSKQKNDSFSGRQSSTWVLYFIKMDDDYRGPTIFLDTLKKVLQGGHQCQNLLRL